MSHSRFIFKRTFAAFLIGLALLCSIIDANGAQVVDIRTGFHQTFSRIVVQFDSDVEFNIIKNLNNKKVLVEIQPVEIRFNPREIKIDPGDKFVNRIEYELTLITMKVSLYLKSSNVRLDYYKLAHPNRVVIDVYQARQLKNAGLNVQPDSSGEAKPDSSVKAQIDSGLFSNLQSYQDDDSTTSLPDNQFKDAKSIDPNVNESVYSANNAKPESGFLIFFSVLGAFFLIDAIILGIYFFRRKKKFKNSAPGSEPEPEKKKKQKPASPKVPEAAPQDFKTALTATIQENMSTANKSVMNASHSNIVNNSQITSKIESLINSLSESMRPSDTILLEFPELEQVTRELQKISPDENISPELLIGKDGVEFIKNLTHSSSNKL